MDKQRITVINKYSVTIADTQSHLHWHGPWGHLSAIVHSHHALHVRLHDRNHGEALLLLLLLLLHGYHACRNTHTHCYDVL